MSNWLRVALQWGAIGSIAAFLVWFTTTRVQVKMDSIADMLNQHNERQEKLLERATGMEYWMRVQTDISTNSCVNQAGNDAAKRNNCFHRDVSAPPH